MNKTGWPGIWGTGTLGTACRTSQICSSLHQHGESFSVGAFPGLCAWKEQQSPVQHPLQSLRKNSDPISSFTATEICMLRMKLGKSSRQNWNHYVCATWVAVLWPHVMPSENKRICLQSTALICVCKALLLGEARGRLEEEKSRNWVMSKLTGWTQTLNERGCFLPNRTLLQKYTTVPGQSLHLELWLWIISLQNSSLKIQCVSQTAAAETTF